MNQLTRNKVLLTIIAVLLITNLVLLFMFLRLDNTKNEFTKGPGFTERLKKEVGFTEEQMAVFEPKKKAFWTNMRRRFSEMKATKQNLYRHMYNPSVPDSVMESHADSIGQQQKELDLFIVRHFQDVRKMCTPEQLPKYDSVLPAIIERMTAGPQRRRR